MRLARHCSCWNFKNQDSERWRSPISPNWFGPYLRACRRPIMARFGGNFRPCDHQGSRQRLSGRGRDPKVRRALYPVRDSQYPPYQPRTAFRDGNGYRNRSRYRDADSAGSGQLDWRFSINGRLIDAVTIQQTAWPDMPPAVTAFIRATNTSDIEGLLKAFSDDALVNDQFGTIGEKRILRNGQRVT